MLKSFRQPITLPAIVNSYFEPSSSNVSHFDGGNRAAHQIYVSHQIRLLNTVLGAVRGKLGPKIIDIANQNRDLTNSDLLHLTRIVDQLLCAELVDTETAAKMKTHLSDLFSLLFPKENTESRVFIKNIS